MVDTIYVTGVFSYVWTLRVSFSDVQRQAHKLVTCSQRIQNKLHLSVKKCSDDVALLKLLYRAGILEQSSIFVARQEQMTINVSQRAQRFNK